MVGLRGRTIHLHQTRDVPEEAIAQFPTTLLMNILTYNRLSVAYPRMTLSDIGILHLTYVHRQDAYGIQGTIIKYVQRGYKIRYPIQGYLHRQIPHNPPSIHCADDYCPRRFRSFYLKLY